MVLKMKWWAMKKTGISSGLLLFLINLVKVIFTLNINLDKVLVIFSPLLAQASRLCPLLTKGTSKMLALAWCF
ncbi:hypothetical protein SAMN05421682_1138 [Chryseobacterium indoltheticum]|uniref:Uncharacterized protein n=2 Tax=Chryseobacterium indoltheticum TaxID=254 RepID=A0A381F574_9FLAO|nr:hypothetical protein EG358_15940 [Chryseobacterium indoltheticum]SIR13252.1 hypothetical protein SAMN05421682_1138 [Chryseobacterium indoltheticum]SUX41647.1 Uncharacterised protein [Chryseobacterium indoltheticum]